MTQPDPNVPPVQSAVETGASGTPDPAATGTGGTDPGVTTPGQPDPSETVSKADFDKMFQRMQAADQRAAQRELEMKQLREKDMPEMDKLKSQLMEQTDMIEQQKAIISQLQIENAFHADNTYRWKSVDAAQRLLDTDNIVVDGGKVRGMKEALSSLAKKHPYLLEDDKPSGSGTGSGGAPSTSGVPAGSKGGTQTDKAAMAKRFPALRSRIG